MALSPTSSRGSGSGGGSVNSVTATDASVVFAGTATDPTVRTSTLDVIATLHAPAGNWSNNSKKITSLANGAGAQDAAAFGQIPTALPPNGAAGGSLAGTYPSPTIAAGAVTNTEVGAAAAIARSKLDFGSGLVNADVAAAAAIAYSKLNLGTSIVNADIAAAAAIAVTKLADPTTGKVIGSASNAAAAVFPPGFEIDYVQITAPVNITSTTEAGSTTIITSSAITFDGTAVYLEFYSPRVLMDTNAAGDSAFLTLMESGSSLGRIANLKTPAVTSQPGFPVFARYRFTPSAGSHTYIIGAFVSSTASTPSVGAGAAGSGNLMPAYLRFVKA